MADGEGTGSNAVWAVAFVIIVALILGALYYSGMLSGGKKQTTDINITAPSR